MIRKPKIGNWNLPALKEEQENGSEWDATQSAVRPQEGAFKGELSCKEVSGTYTSCFCENNVLSLVSRR